MVSYITFMHVGGLAAVWEDQLSLHLFNAVLTTLEPPGLLHATIY